MSIFHIIEGATCAGKTTFTRSIHAVTPQRIILEHPPLDKGQILVETEYYQHQLNVFDSFMASFHDAPHGEWWVDYSPLGCVPFTRALVSIGRDECATLIPYMIGRINVLCKRHELYLDKYIPISYEVQRERLLRRGRLGDDTWDETLLRAIIKSYDDFFENDVELIHGNRINSVK